MKKLVSMVMLICFSLTLSSTSKTINLEKNTSMEAPNPCYDDYANHYMFAEFVYYSMYDSGVGGILAEAWFTLEVMEAKSNLKACLYGL
ncbi:hypothetical protein [Winogradskyella algicola]|uniref:hypothetical protein n=1 Tax=Winogradskyella algicola TaxID=2575815 RepID=UPI00110819AA|nr:hypothetical protein [Winogradskyella algicola]